jgi:hypothetical protein
MVNVSWLDGAKPHVRTIANKRTNEKTTFFFILDPFSYKKDM